MLGGGSYSRVFQSMALGSLLSLIEKLPGQTRKSMGILMHKPNVEDLNTLAELFTAGKVKPVIDRTYPLIETTEALRYFGKGSALGKVVIRM